MGTGYAQLHGPQGGFSFDVTEVQDTWTEMVDIDNNLSLFEVMKGKTVNQYLGSYSGGAGFIRVRNRLTNKVKMLEPLALVTEEVTRYVTPFQVQEDDILEQIWVTTPT